MDGWVMLLEYLPPRSKLAHPWFLNHTGIHVATDHKGLQGAVQVAILHHLKHGLHSAGTKGKAWTRDSTLTLKPVLSTHTIIFYFYIMLLNSSYDSVWHYKNSNRNKCILIVQLCTIEGLRGAAESTFTPSDPYHKWFMFSNQIQTFWIFSWQPGERMVAESQLSCCWTWFSESPKTNNHQQFI